MTRIFISYAREADETLVETLTRDLEQRGFEVWRDRSSMPSRGLPFPLEIRKAIDSCDRFLLVGSPAAWRSDFVRREWGWALLACKPITPILRAGDLTSVPEELDKLHFPDFRSTRSYDEALAELVRVLSEPVPRLAPLYGDLPALPPHFVERPEALRSMSRAVLSDILEPIVITSAQQTLALQGMAGIGKSVLACALARSCEVRRSFHDGILWLRLGRLPDLLSSFRVMAASLRDDVAEYVDAEVGGQRLAGLLWEKTVLVILDDVWAVEDAQLFINALGPRSRVVITTRDGGLANSCGAKEVRLTVLVEEQALELLADWSGNRLEDLAADARKLARECGYLPLALALCGAMARSGTPWVDLLEAVSEADLEFVSSRLPNYPYTDVLRSIKVSVEALEPDEQRFYEQLAVFPQGVDVPVEVVVRLWRHTAPQPPISRPGGLKARHARKMLRELETKALLGVQREGPEAVVSLHDLQHDYLRAIGADAADLHARLVDSYRADCRGGWHTGPDDGYFFRRLASHVVRAGLWGELESILCDLRFLDAVCRRGLTLSFLADYDLAGAMPQLPQELSDRIDEFARFVRARSHALVRDPGLVLQEVHNYSATGPVAEAADALEDHPELGASVWLRQFNRPVEAETVQFQTLEGHGGCVFAIALAPDDRLLASASMDKTVRIWDLSTGRCLHVATGHTQSPTAVVILPHSHRVASGCDAGSIRFWSLETGKCQSVVGGAGEGQADAEDKRTSRSITRLAVTADERFLLVGRYGGLLGIWDLEAGAWVRERKFRSGIGDIVVFPDGERVLTCHGMLPDSANDALVSRLSDLETLLRLPHESIVGAGAVTGDGQRIVTGAHDGGVRIWDADSGEQLATYQDEDSTGIRDLFLTSDDASLVVGHCPKLETGTVVIRDLATGDVRGKIPGTRGSIERMALTTDDRKVLTAGWDDNIKVWDIQRTSTLERSAYDGHGFMHITFTPDGGRIVASERDVLMMWDLREQRCMWRGACSCDHISDIAVTPDGRRAVVSTDYRRFGFVFDLWSGERLQDLGPASFSSNTVAVTPDGSRAYCAGWRYDKGSELLVWDLARGRRLRHEIDEERRLDAAAVTPDGRLLLLADRDGLRALDPETLDCRWSSSELEHSVAAIAVSPDGEKAVTVGGDYRIRAAEVFVWRVADGERLRSLDGHTDSVKSVAVTPDGRHVVTCGDDHTLMVWSLDSGERLACFVSDRIVFSCAVSPDGELILADMPGGGLFVLRPENLPAGPVIATAWRRPKSRKCAYGCVHCRGWSECRSADLGGLVECPHCGSSLRLNTFTIRGDWRVAAGAWERLAGDFG